MSEDSQLDQFTSNRDDGKNVQFGPIDLNIPKDWSVTTIGEILELLTDFEANGSFSDLKENVSQYSEPNYAWYVRATDLENGNLPGSGEVKYTDKDSYHFLEKSSLEGGEVLMSKRGQIGKVYLLPDVNMPATVAPNTYLLKLKNSLVLNHYMYYYLSSHIGYRQLKRRDASTTIGAIYKEDLKKVEFPRPPMEEQRKIASILYNVDQAIQKTEQITKQIRRIKKGLQNELFTEGYFDHDSFKETRIGRIPESWELDKVKDDIDLVSGAHVKSDLVSADESLRPYLTGPEDFDEFGFTVTKYTDEPTNFCKPNDTLVTVKGSGCGKSTYADQRACISRQLKALRPNNGLEPLYLFYYIKNKQNLLETLAEGSAIPGLSNAHLTSLNIPLPEIKEQRVIAKTLREFDYQIQHEQEYKNCLQTLKRGLMQDLLSGTVRTTDTNIEVLPEVAQHG